MSIFKNYGLDNINDFESLNCSTQLEEHFHFEGDSSKSLKTSNSSTGVKVNDRHLNKAASQSTSKDATNKLLRRK